MINEMNWLLLDLNLTAIMCDRTKFPHTQRKLSARVFGVVREKFNQHGIMRHFNSDFMHINISKNWIMDWRPLSNRSRHAVSQHCALICQSSTKIYAFLRLLEIGMRWSNLVCSFFCIWGWKSIEMRGERWNSNFLKRNFRFLFFFVSFLTAADHFDIVLYFLVCMFFLFGWRRDEEIF